jgi:hypothetical protein
LCSFSIHRTCHVLVCFIDAIKQSPSRCAGYILLQAGNGFCLLKHFRLKMSSMLNSTSFQKRTSLSVIGCTVDPQSEMSQAAGTIRRENLNLAQTARSRGAGVELLVKFKE